MTRVREKAPVDHHAALDHLPVALLREAFSGAGGAIKCLETPRREFCPKIRTGNEAKRR